MVTLKHVPKYIQKTLLQKQLTKLALHCGLNSLEK